MNDVIDAQLIYKMLQGGLQSLALNKHYLDMINVFPVSDSDTGTNMLITFQKGIDQIKVNQDSFSAVLSSFTHGLLMGSRGNSGFLLSQYFLGIMKHVNDKNTVEVNDFLRALKVGYNTSKNAIITPVEGTMLTIMRDGIKVLVDQIDAIHSFDDFFSLLSTQMLECVLQTTKQMPILQKSNAVDSGALGLFVIFDGMIKAFYNNQDYFDCESSEVLPKVSLLDSIKELTFFRYCCEGSVKLKKGNDESITKWLKTRGDSLAVSLEEDIYKFHIHTNDPDTIIKSFSDKNIGSVVSQKVDDLFDSEEFSKLKCRKYDDLVVVSFIRNDWQASFIENLGVDVVFKVPNGHQPTVIELSQLTNKFDQENTIILTDCDHVFKQLAKLKRNNLFVKQIKTLVEMTYTLSTTMLTLDYLSVVKHLKNTNLDDIAYLELTKINPDKIKALLSDIIKKIINKNYANVIIFTHPELTRDTLELITSYLGDSADIEINILENVQGQFHCLIGAF